MVSVFNSVFGKIFDLLFYLFQGWSPWVGMIIISFLTSLLMLLIYRYTSNQEGIKRVKNKIKAHLLELRLYKDDLGTTFRAQGNLLKYNFRYMGYAVAPMLVMIIPVILIIIQLEFWFDYQSLNPGQTALLKVELNENYDPMNIALTLESPSGVVIETPALRIAEEKEICWRLRAEKNGVHDLLFKVNNETIKKNVAVGGLPLVKISPIKVQSSFMAQLLYPCESPIPASSPVKRIEISYPSKRMEFFGWHLPWLVPYFLLSIILGFALKGFFKVEI